MARRKIWGFTFDVAEGRRTNWPVSIKDEAVRRIECGASADAVAQELGAHPALVRKWRRKDRHENGGHVETPVQFAELSVSDPEDDDPTPIRAPVPCRLHLRGMIFEFSSEIVPDDLTRIVGVLRGAP